MYFDFYGILLDLFLVFEQPDEHLLLDHPPQRLPLVDDNHDEDHQTTDSHIKAPTKGTAINILYDERTENVDANAQHKSADRQEMPELIGSGHIGLFRHPEQHPDQIIDLQKITGHEYTEDKHT